jgi:opacity protein-like surface antigen
LPRFPGIDIHQEGEFQLEARGGFAFGGAVTYYFADAIGIEARLDTVDFNIDTVAPSFVASVDLPPPLPPLGAELDLGRGAVEVERLFPVSVNLKARTTGRTRFVAAGGLSYLPRLRFLAQQTVGLGVSGIPGLGQLAVTTVELQAEALPDEEDEGRLGFNVGAGVEIDLGDNVALAGEVRFFRFQSQTFVWNRVSAPTSQLEEFLLEELERQLSPIELEPTFFQATGGIVVRF